jgi:hypothetical protein
MSCLLTNSLHLVYERSKLEKWTKFETMRYCKTIHFQTNKWDQCIKKWENLCSWVNQCFPKLILSNLAITCDFGVDAIATIA